MDLRLAARVLGPYVVITMGGELDVETAPALAGYLATALDQRPGRDIILDVSGVSFADAAGLSALLAADTAVRDRGGSLRLAGPSRQLRKILGITGLTARLTTYPSTYAASVWLPVPACAQHLAPAARAGPASPPSLAGRPQDLRRPRA
jgi:anti-sigma B factor antagonist